MFPRDDVGGEYEGPPARVGRSIANRDPWCGDLEVLHRFAPLDRPSTLDIEKRTVEAVILTESPVPRRDARGPFLEITPMSGIDPKRVRGVQLRNMHRSGSVLDAIGIIEDAWIEGDALVGRLRFSLADDVTPIFARVVDGSLPAVSAGYRGSGWTEGTDAQGRRTRTAGQVAVIEASLVLDPADPRARLRHQQRSSNVENEDLIETPSPEEAKRAARKEVRALGHQLKLSREAVDDLIDGELEPDAIKARMLDMHLARAKSQPLIRVHGPQAGDPNLTRQHREEALYARMSGEAPSEAARPYMSDRLRDHMRACVEAQGQSTRAMDAVALVRAAMHHTTDFPGLLTGVGNRMLMASWEAASSPVRTRLSKQTTHADFRPVTKLKLSDIGQLQKVEESGEIVSTTRGEAAESYRIETYASLFSLSLQALINDDTGAFADWSRTAGRMAAQTEASVIIANLTQSSGAGPLMGEDGKRLFHADHGNLAGSGAALDVDSLTAAKLALRRQKALDGVTPINATPAFLLVAPEQETLAEQLMAAIYAASPEDANPFTGKLTVLVEPRLTGPGWYVFSDPGVLPVLEHAYLAGQAGPQMASRQGWEVLGTEFRVHLHFGAAAIDFRGAYRNPGA